MLQADRNKLSVLPHSLWDLSNLEELFLANNVLTAISSKVACLKNLDMLFLKGNAALPRKDSFNFVGRPAVVNLQRRFAQKMIVVAATNYFASSFERGKFLDDYLIDEKMVAKFPFLILSLQQFHRWTNQAREATILFRLMTRDPCRPWWLPRDIGKIMCRALWNMRSHWGSDFK